jgi:quercetin dioxygenase-like cupin family protein
MRLPPRIAIMIESRDLFAAAFGMLIAIGATTFAQSERATLRTAAFDWNEIPVRHEEVRSVREFFNAPTATLEELAVHVTTLKPGDTSHAPHKHFNEELVIVKEGVVEAYVQGEYQRLGPGSVIFNASNELHAIRNVGDEPATYHVINWHPL